MSGLGSRCLQPLHPSPVSRSGATESASVVSIQQRKCWG